VFVSKHFAQYSPVFKSTWKSSPRPHSSNNRLTKDCNQKFQPVKPTIKQRVIPSLIGVQEVADIANVKSGCRND